MERVRQTAREEEALMNRKEKRRRAMVGKSENAEDQAKDRERVGLRTCEE